MGCCMSSTAERRPNQHHQHHQHHTKKQSLEKKSKTQVSKTPLPVQHPPHEVVETVKEIVLSESPNITKTLPKPPPTTTTPQNHSQNQLTTSLQPPPPPPPKPSNNQEIKEDTRVEKRKQHHHQVEAEELVVTPEVSQVSELYSVTDSYSTATTVTEIREDEAMSKRTSNGNHNVKNRATSSPSTKRRVQRERTLSSKSSPAGRERLPVSKRAVSGPIRGSVGPTGSGGGGGSSSSASRRSPATGRGRGSGKLTGRGGNRSRVVDKEERNGDVSRNNQQEHHRQQREGNDESLYNPLVSLECFIFL